VVVLAHQRMREKGALHGRVRIVGAEQRRVVLHVFGVGGLREERAAHGLDAQHGRLVSQALVDRVGIAREVRDRDRLVQGAEGGSRHDGWSCWPRVSMSQGAASAMGRARNSATAASAAPAGAKPGPETLPCVYGPQTPIPDGSYPAIKGVGIGNCRTCPTTLTSLLTGAKRTSCSGASRSGDHPQRKSQRSEYVTLPQRSLKGPAWVPRIAGAN